MTTVPEFIPVLSAGAHADPKKGACVMEMVSFLAGEEWSDSPACTHPVLASMARVVNDRLSDAERPALVPLIGRLFGTAGPDGVEGQALSVRLAAWCARRSLPMAHPSDRGACEAAIRAAEAWADDPSSDAAYAAVAADAAYAASAAAAANAAYAVAEAAANDPTTDLVDLLTGLLDEYDRLTGRTPNAIDLTPLATLPCQV